MSEPIANDQIHAGLSEQADCATGFAGRALLAALTDAADPADGKPSTWGGVKSISACSNAVTISSNFASSSCAYRKSDPGILMVQSAQDRMADNTSSCLGGA